MTSIMTIPAPRPATRPRLQQGVGVGRAGTRAGLRRGRWAPLAPASGIAICPQGPWEPVSLTGTQAWSPVPLGASSVPTAAQASGRGLWRSRGSSGRAGLLLPAAGPASTPLPGVGPEQGGQGAIGWGASALHLEVGSQGGVLARSPLRGGLGIVDPNHVLQDEHSLGQNLQGLPQLLHPLALGWRKPWGQGHSAPASCPSPPLPLVTIVNTTATTDKRHPGTRAGVRTPVHRHGT